MSKIKAISVFSSAGIGELLLENTDIDVVAANELLPKARQSTKMIGESLEQHCEIEFNKLRATAFRNAYFEKDNDIKTGSKEKIQRRRQHSQAKGRSLGRPLHRRA